MISTLQIDLREKEQAKRDAVKKRDYETAGKLSKEGTTTAAPPIFDVMLLHPGAHWPPSNSDASVKRLKKEIDEIAHKRVCISIYIYI